MKNLAKKVIKGITPPLITTFISKIIHHSDSESRQPSFIELQKSDQNVRTDKYIQWVRDILGGLLTPGNLKLFDYAVRHMPAAEAIVEIVSLFGLSTNIISYLTVKYHRDNPFFTCDPWVYESTDKALAGHFDYRTKAFRNYAKKAFIMNTALFSRARKPYTIEAYSKQFFGLWRLCSTTKDVFGRSVTLGGLISFAYIDGAHTYDVVKEDFLGVDPHLLPGGFILFDDTNDVRSFPEVMRAASEVEQNPSYELVFKTPNYLFKKKG